MLAFSKLCSIDAKERDEIRVPYKRKTPKKSILVDRTNAKVTNSPKLNKFDFYGAKTSPISQLQAQQGKHDENSGRGNVSKLGVTKKARFDESLNRIHPVERYAF